MRALILDRSHAVLLAAGQLPDVPLGGSPRPLATLEAGLAARGLPALPPPDGSRTRADGAGRDFLFIGERFDAPAGMAWHPLREVAGADELWSLYVALVLGGYEPPTREVDVWAFGNTPVMAARLAHLVACGAKRVTMGWVEASRVDGSPIAFANGVNVVTDFFGYPKLVLRSTHVAMTPFGAITSEQAAGEGEGDLTRADWHEGHVAYFTRESQRVGLPFDDQATIAVETFAVLHVVGRADL